MDEAEQDGLSPVRQGRRICLISCDDPHTRLKSGARGLVTFVDGLGTVHVAWDDGTRLGLIPGVDEWEIDAGASRNGGEASHTWSKEVQP